MLPPPAPIVSMSTVWVRSGCRATDTSDLNSGRPGSTAMSDEVPPVSKVMMLSMPLMSPKWRPPMTPATGPDITVSMGVDASMRALAAPPSDFIISARERGKRRSDSASSSRR
jgi:hypothetical protein